MATYALVHGAGDSASSWDLVALELRDRGHDVVAVDLPSEDDSAGWADYAGAVASAVGPRDDVVLVAHSLGGFTAPLVCTRIPVDLMVMVAAMIPSPGETADEWWVTSGYQRAMRGRGEEDDLVAVFYQDVPPAMAAAALRRARGQSDTPMREPWPLERWPDVPTRFVLCRDDRMFPADWLRGFVRGRLGIVPDEMDGGHCPYLSRPTELAERLETYRLGVRGAPEAARRTS